MEVLKSGILERLTKIGADTNSENRVVACAELSDQIFKMNHVKVRIANMQDPRHVKTHEEEIIYLPDRHFDLPIFNHLKDQFREVEYQKVIAYHEFGHAAQIACVHNNQQIHIKGSSLEGDINYLFNGDAVPNRINNFLKELFKEGFADCYSGLCLFKETGDVKVFKRISQVRAKRYGEFKDEKGKYFIHPNFNVKAAENMGHAVELFLKNDQNIFNLPFTGAEVSIERYIERSVVAGCIVAVISELRTNDAFLNHFRKFASGFALDKHQVQTLLAGHSNVDEVVAYEKNQGLVSFFLEFKKRLPDSYTGVLPDGELFKLLVNTDYKRLVDPTMEFMDVAPIPYSAGLEAVKEMVLLLRTTCQIPEVRLGLSTGVPKIK
jgi:hypothetical protein